MSKSGWMLVLISALFTVAANLLMRAGLDRFGGFPSEVKAVPLALLKLLAQPRFLSGLIFYGLAAVVWFKVIAGEPLTVAYPVLVSTTFILVSVGAVLLFGESMSLKKIGGMIFMLAGIALISKG